MAARLIEIPFFQKNDWKTILHTLARFVTGITEIVKKQSQKHKKAKQGVQKEYHITFISRHCIALKQCSPQSWSRRAKYAILQLEECSSAND